MFVASLSGPQMMYRHQTGGPIFGQASFLPPDRLVIASTDGYVTAINEQNGKLQWEFSTGFDLYQTPLTQPDLTYAVTRQNQLYCISSQDGAELWTARGIEQVVSRGTQRIYARGTGGTLVALDVQSGDRIADVQAPAYSMALSNDLTDRLYLLTDDGTLLCLREIDAYFPTVFRPLPEPPQTPEPTTTRAPAAAATRSAEPSEPALDDDPFGSDAAVDEAGVDDQPDAGAVEPEVDVAEPAADSNQPMADEPAAEQPSESTDQPADEQDADDDPFDFG
jgi:hypothetical protein